MYVYFAILIGLGDEALVERRIRDKDIISATQSMRAFVYDALLIFGDKYKNYILNDIKCIYGKMLDVGAATFWGTEKQDEKFLLFFIKKARPKSLALTLIR